jgi:2-oxoglutarate dehydrogenase E1 component
MERFEQVSNDKILKVDTAYTKEGLTQVANAVCNLPRKKFISKNSKADQRQKKQCFETDKLIGPWRAPCLWIITTRRYDVRISGQDVERGTFLTVTQ